MHFDIILLQRQRKELLTQKLLDFEIRGLQDELVKGPNMARGGVNSLFKILQIN